MAEEQERREVLECAPTQRSLAPVLADGTLDVEVEWCPDTEREVDSAPPVDSESELGREYGGG